MRNRERTLASDQSEAEFAFTSFGVNIRAKTNSAELFRVMERTATAALGWQVAEPPNSRIDFCIELRKRSDRRIDILRNGEQQERNLEFEFAIDRFASLVRHTVAEHSSDFAFIHAGAVAWKGRGIIFPARSFRGKSALTAALVRLGAKYYSDEYAVLNKRGLLRPFPKDLSLRGIKDRFTQVERSVESLGGKAGKRPIPVGLVLITEFKKGAEWEPQILSSGATVMEVLQNSVSIRRNPEFVLSAVNAAVANSLAFKTKRGEADAAARLVLRLLDEA